MPALSTSSYGKAPATMAAMTDFADRMTAALENGLGAVNALNDGVATGAPVNQASVNTLLKVMQDLGEIANSARQAAVDEAAESEAASATTPTATDGKVTDTPRDTSAKDTSAKSPASSTSTSAKS